MVPLNLMRLKIVGVSLRERHLVHIPQEYSQKTKNQQGLRRLFDVVVLYSPIIRLVLREYRIQRICQRVVSRRRNVLIVRRRNVGGRNKCQDTKLLDFLMLVDHSMLQLIDLLLGGNLVVHASVGGSDFQGSISYFGPVEGI